MDCPSCGATPLEGAKFCMECGALLPRACPGCGHSIPAVAKFCPECGTSLVGDVARPRFSQTTTAITQPTAAQSSPTPGSSAERRQLTVMFCDLVGSTALAARLDPEDLREIIAAYHRRVAKVVERFDGFIAKYMGDGVLVYFGYPRAHEDDAERAVQAGLKLVQTIERVRPLAQVELQVRVGIATGLVVVGDLIGEGAAQEQAVVGETPNLAARLQTMAKPNAVAIAASTRRLIGELFEYEDLGAVEMKGFAAPVRAYRVVGSSAAESRFEAFHSTAAAMTPLVGRDEEVDLLLRRWTQVKGGDGRVVLLSGEPGIGKSRLTRTLQERLSGEPHVRLLYFCSPHHQASALFPFITQLERAAGFVREDAPESKLDKLEAMLAQSTSEVAPHATVLAELLSIPSGDRYPPLDLPPQKRKERTFQTLLAQLDGLAARRPALIVFEDVQWIDPTSLELLELTVERVSRLPVLLLITFRPEFQPPWVGRPHVTMHPLNRLGRREGLVMIERVAGGKALPKEVADQIVARTDGVPLFLEELTKAVLESAMVRSDDDGYVITAPLPLLAIPTTLHASLMARLDRLSRVREIAEVGAAIGREFSHELIRAVSTMPESELEKALDQLVASELVFRRGTPPDAVYAFKHRLVQEAAYSTLLRGARQQLHARIAAVLEERFPDTAQTEPELLAHHFTEAGLAERAISYWRRAGERASARSANVEALAHLTKALGLVSALPDMSRRIEAEFALQTAIGGPLIVTKGYSAPEVEEAYLRAQELGERLGRSGELFPVLRGLWNCYLARAELREAHALAERLVALAAGEHEDEPLRRALAHRALGSTLFFLGRFYEAAEQLSRGIAFDEAATATGDGRTSILLYADCPGVVCRAYLSCGQWHLGFPARAVATMDAGLVLSERLADAHVHVRTLSFAAMLRQWQGNFEAARHWGEAAMIVAREHSIPQWLPMGMMCRGAALSRLGQVEEGIAELHAGLAAWNRIGSHVFDPMWLGWTAEAHAAAGQIDAAFVVLDRAADVAAATSETFYLAELHRLRGALLMEKGEPAGAEPWLRRATALAQSQGAKSVELRAAMSLARLWYDQGRHTEARDLLGPVYDWFTEGFDTPDLREAKALLDAMRR